MLIRYLRRKNKHPRGIVIALDSKHIGWSLCNPRDKWNRQRARMIAEARAKKGKHINCAPRTIQPLCDWALDVMLKREQPRAVGNAGT